MGLKTLTVIALLGLTLIAVLSFAQAAPPSGTPGNILDTIAGLQTQITELFENATDQQSAIQAEADARIAGDLELQTNASEQQTAIDAIQSGSATHFGQWNTTFVANTTYQAQTDGFIFAKAPVDPYDPLYPNNWFVVQIRTSANVGFSPMITIYDNANASVHDDWATAIFPIRKGDYWRVYGWDRNGAAHEWVQVYLLPLET